MGVLTPVAEQLAKPFPHAIALLTLDDVASSSHKKLPAGCVSYSSPLNAEESIL
jgi:(E)-4-hydroxy-3-methylbut-2-enyl-diphosphate synthase